MNKKNNNSKQDKHLLWEELSVRCGAINDLSPAEQENLAKDLEKFIRGNPKSARLAYAQSALELLAKRNPSEQKKWSIEMIDDVISHPDPKQRLFDFKINVIQLFYIQSPKEKIDQVISHLANTVVLYEDCLEVVVNVLNEKKPIGEQLRYKNLLKDKLYEIGDDKYYAGDFLLGQKAYSAILKIDPSEEIAEEKIQNSKSHMMVQERLEKVIPKDALRSYYRYRSAIAANDLRNAKIWLQTAVDMANADGVDFIEARQSLDALLDEIKRDATNPEKLPAAILGQIQQLRRLIESGDPDSEKKLVELQASINAKRLELSEIVELSDKVARVTVLTNYKNAGLAALKEKNWGSAEEAFKKIKYIDKEALDASSILQGLSKLLKARELIAKLRREPIPSKQLRREVEKILSDTGEVAQLSELWNETDNKYFEILEKQQLKRFIIAGGLAALFIVFGIFALLIGGLYLWPRQSEQLVCPAPFNDIDMIVNYPLYMSYGDSQKMTLTIANAGTDEITGFVQVVFDNPSRVRLSKNNPNKIILKGFSPDDLKTEELEFGFIRQPKFINSPDIIRFSVRIGDNGNYVDCSLKDSNELGSLVISTPVPYLKEIYQWQIGLMGASGLAGVIVSGLGKYILDSILELRKSEKVENLVK